MPELEALNHHADIYVYDVGTCTEHLIDFTFTNTASWTGKNGAVPGGHAKEAEDSKCVQYWKEFIGMALRARLLKGFLQKSDTAPLARACACTGRSLW